MRSLLPALLLWALAISRGGCDKIYDAMYTSVDAAPCVRLLTKDGEIGCSTEGRVVGVLRLYDEDHDDVLTSHSADDKIAIVMPESLFNQSTVKQLDSSLSLAGIMVLANEKTKPSSYSPDEATPQSFMAKVRGEPLYEWNPIGEPDPIIHQRYGFGIVRVADADAEGVRSKALLNEEKRAKNEFVPYVAEFHYPMYAKGNSLACLEEATCLPVGGFSVWTTLQKLNKTLNKDIVLATAMMDSSAFFHDLAFGASSYQSGVVSLTAATLALSKPLLTHTCPNATQLPKQIMVALLNAEQFGYVGSRRLARDLGTELECNQWSAKFERPYRTCLNPYKPNTLYTSLNLTNIDTILEVGQVSLEEGDTLYAHIDRSDPSPDNIARSLAFSAMISANFSGGTGVSVTGASEQLPGLPPSSIPSFVKEKRDRGLGGVGYVSLQNHNTSFTNPYYLSRFDSNLTASQVDSLCSTAKIIAKTLYATAGGPASGTCQAEIDANVDCELVSALFHCLTQDFNCPLVNKYSGEQDEGPLSHYAGVYFLVDPDRIIGVPRFLNRLLAESLVEHNEYGSALHDAVDPVLAFNYDKDKWDISSEVSWGGNASLLPSMLFSESNWAADIGTRLYRREDPFVQRLMLGLGVAITVLAGIGGYLFRPYVIQNFKT